MKAEKARVSIEVFLKENNLEGLLKQLGENYLEAVEKIGISLGRVNLRMVSDSSWAKDCLKRLTKSILINLEFSVKSPEDYINAIISSDLDKIGFSYLGELKEFFISFEEKASMLGVNVVDDDNNSLFESKYKKFIFFYWQIWANIIKSLNKEIKFFYKKVDIIKDIKKGIRWEMED